MNTANDNEGGVQGRVTRASTLAESILLLKPKQLVSNLFREYAISLYDLKIDIFR